jgi:hypothetical protein
VQKEIEIGANSLDLLANFTYRDEFNSSLDETDFSWVDSSFFVNVRASYFFGTDQQYEFSVWAENLTEEKICSAIVMSGILNYAMECRNPNPGIVFYGVTVAANF